jgi:hypothetical protein
MAINLRISYQQTLLREAWAAHQARLEAGEDFFASRAAYYMVFDSID